MTLHRSQCKITWSHLWSEPFRVFFPAGLAIGMVGVSLWPAYYAGLLSFYPGVAHARLMIQGFMASFIVGFLGTAGPRITSTRPFSRVEVLTLLTLDLFAVGLHCGGANRAGDFVFLFFLLAFAGVLGTRFARRQDWPPPNFALVVLGLLNGLVGAGLLALNENAAYSLAYRIGAALLEQGFVLLPILGVGPFLLPRLLDIPRNDNLPEGRALPRGWVPRALFAAAIGLAIDGTLILETFGLTISGAALRALAVVAYLVLSLPRRGRSFLGDSLRMGIAAIPLGFVVEALWPEMRIGALHIVFISGFSFIVLTVATRVVFGHSGNSQLFARRLPFHIAVAVLIWLATFSRYTADLAPRVRTIHLVVAAILWLLAAALWAARVLPKVVIAEIEE